MTQQECVLGACWGSPQLGTLKARWLANTQAPKKGFPFKENPCKQATFSRCHHWALISQPVKLELGLDQDLLAQEPICI